MAMSIPRVDPSSPASVAEASFATTRRGFHPDEVRSLLREVAAELGRLQERERFLERELRSAREQPDDATVSLDDETVTRMLGEETLRVLQTARESASQIKIKAEEGAAKILREATEEASRLRHDAEVEAARIRSDAAADAEAEVSLAKQQGREMVNEARAYRERVLSELARRREAARQQIDQLINGRDRLLQVFERARLVAVDVVSELEPLGEPDEYVDLTPTTGPVPMMVPSAALPRRAVPDADGADSGRADDPTEAIPAVDAEPRPGDDVDAEPELQPAAGVTVDEESLDEAGVDEAGVDEVGVDEVEVDEVAVDEAAADHVVADAEPDDGVDADDAATAEVAAADDQVLDDAVFDDPVTDPEASSAEMGTTGAARAEGRATNVVALFPDRGGAEPEAGDVDGLFARLRAETAATDPAVDEPDAAAESDAGGQPDADTGPEAAAEAELGEETVFERRDAELVPLIVASARMWKRVLADEQNDVLDTLRNTQVSALDDLVPAVDEHAARYLDAISDELSAAHAAGAASMSEQPLPSPGELPEVRTFVADHLVGPLRDRLERSVIDAAGETADVVKAVRAVYREWKTQHIDEQLDDVFRLAHGAGVLAAVSVGTPLCWMVDPAGPACPDAEDNALAGAVPAGDAYPTGHRCAPAHAGCRCLLSRPAK